MPAPELDIPDDQDLCLEPLTYDGHNPDAPCVSMKLEDFVSKADLETSSRVESSVKGGTHQRSLTIDFNKDPGGAGGFKMHSLDPMYFRGPPFHATKVTPLERSDRVYRARLEFASPFHRDVVLKFASTNDDRTALKKEYKFYKKKLCRTQNCMVPSCLGLFGKEIDGLEVYCLVLKFVGEPVRCAFEDLPAQERRAVDALHACGVQHNDLHEGNLRLDREVKKAWIVDFEEAEEHECKHQPLILGDLEPNYWKFGCPELFELGMETKLWLALGNFSFCARPVPLNHIFQWKDLVCYAFRDWPQKEKEKAAKLEYQDIPGIIKRKIDEFHEANADWFPAEAKHDSEVSKDARSSGC